MFTSNKIAIHQIEFQNSTRPFISLAVERKFGSSISYEVLKRHALTEGPMGDNFKFVWRSFTRLHNFTHRYQNFTSFLVSFENPFSIELLLTLIATIFVQSNNSLFHCMCSHLISRNLLINYDIYFSFTYICIQGNATIH